MSSSFILSEIANVVDCEHKTAPTVDTSNYFSIRTTDISNGRLDLEKANRVSYETYLEWTKRAIPQPGDLILAREAPVGEVGYIKDGYNVCLGQRTVLIQVTNEFVDKKYLPYYLVNPSTKYDLIVRSTGSVVAHLNMKDIREFEVTLPSPREQEAIAGVLGSLDEKIDLLQRQNKTLEGLAQTLFRHWFVDGIEDDWEEIELGKIASLKYGKFLPIKDLKGGPYPVYSGYSIVGYHDEYMYSDPQLIMVCRGVGGSGDVKISPPNVWITNLSLIIQPEQEWLSQSYLYWSLQTSDRSGLITGSVQSQVTINHLATHVILKPPLALVEKFNQIVSSFEEKIATNAKQISTLETLRNTLLSKLMSGEVRVRL